MQSKNSSLFHGDHSDKSLKARFSKNYGDYHILSEGSQGGANPSTKKWKFISICKFVMLYAILKHTWRTKLQHSVEYRL